MSEDQDLLARIGRLSSNDWIIVRQWAKLMTLQITSICTGCTPYQTRPILIHRKYRVVPADIKQRAALALGSNNMERRILALQVVEVESAARIGIVS